MGEASFRVQHGAPNPRERCRACSLLLELWLADRPNPSIERTAHSKLRLLRPAAHVER